MELSEPLWTTGELAKDHNIPFAKVTYILKSRGIQPVAKAGPCHLYNSAAFEAVRHAIEAIDTRAASRKVTA